MSAGRARWLARHRAGELVTDAERLAAGEELLQSDRADEVEAAQQLLLAAMAGEPRARALAATAYDRLRMLSGRPQKFGTQVVRRDGRAELWPVDPATTDTERSKWGLPGLADLQRRAEAC